MAKFSFVHVFIIALIFSGMVFVSEVEGKKCTAQEFEDKTYCIQQYCEQKCYDRHNDADGYCTYNGEIYRCMCRWNC
ncbi:hypothetical protein LINPERPRIM_LOCUS1579 [Linum perenne]